MRLELDALINRTAAPFMLTFVPSWTGLESEPRAIERRVTEASIARTRGDDAPGAGSDGRSVAGRPLRIAVA